MSYRLQTLQAELSTIERDISNPTNPLLVDEQDSSIDPGELLRGLVDVRGRLEKISGTKIGRGRLVNAVMDGVKPGFVDANLAESTLAGKAAEREINPQHLTELDERVGELESVIGSSTTSLDEVGTSNFPDISSFLTPVLSVITAPAPVTAFAHAAEHSNDDPYATTSH